MQAITAWFEHLNPMTTSAIFIAAAMVTGAILSLSCRCILRLVFQRVQIITYTNLVT